MGRTEAGPVGDAARSDWATRTGGTTDDYLREREEAENFPVALRVLPKEPRRHLAAVYDVARVIDDLGDEAPGDRTAQLVAFRGDLSLIWTGGEPDLPVLRRLAPTVAACGLTRQPFVDLIEANLVDQEVPDYPTYADLLDYCRLSANPIGRMVLEIFGVATPGRVEHSDRICTALQIIEHCQDIAEDRRAGRIYMPLEDLDAFGVEPSDLDAGTASLALRKLVAFEAGRARALLESGLPLLPELTGWARVAVTGYAAGGLAALAAIKRVKWDVMSSYPQSRRWDVIRQFTALMTRRKAGS
jgi:squalene synthase HpnC